MENTRHILAEFMVRRKYDSKGIVLPDKFWNLPKYKKDYQHQIRLAVKLLKIYDFELLFLTAKENAWMYSLGYTKIDELVEKVKDKLSKQAVLDNQKSKPVSQKPKAEIKFRKQERSNFKDG